ncbi:hypothetical protein ACHAXN_008036, partial [Cyclotella atomus]
MDTNLNAVKKDETYDVASHTEGSHILVTEPMLVQTTGGTWGTDVVPSVTSVEESIIEGGTSGDDEPRVSSAFAEGSTICNKNVAVVFPKGDVVTVMNGRMADSEVESKDANNFADDLFGAESLKNHMGAVVVQKGDVVMVMNGGMADSEVESTEVAGANKFRDDLFGAESLKNPYPSLMCVFQSHLFLKNDEQKGDVVTVKDEGMADSEVESKGVADANKFGDDLFGAESLKNHMSAVVVLKGDVVTVMNGRMADSEVESKDANNFADDLFGKNDVGAV